eukprot:1150220-Pelagomonas_calceolata.AAC.7
MRAREVKRKRSGGCEWTLCNVLQLNSLAAAHDPGRQRLKGDIWLLIGWKDMIATKAPVFG